MVLCVKHSDSLSESESGGVDIVSRHIENVVMECNRNVLAVAIFDDVSWPHERLVFYNLAEECPVVGRT